VTLKVKNIAGSIKFWIALFFLVRLIGITNPPLEIGHNWRQVTGLMVARNFLEIDNSIGYPRVDDNGGESGIIAMEFPSLNYLHYIMAEFFGYQHWYGRLINLIISSLGIWYFYKVLKHFFNHQLAFSASLCLLGSIWFSFSRKMMPDTYCIALFFIGLYYGTNYLNKGKVLNLIVSILLITLSFLSKIPAIIYTPILILLLFNGNEYIKRKYLFGSLLLLPLLATYAWYFVWNPYLSSTYGNWYNIGKPLQEGFIEIVSNAPNVLEKFYFSAFNSYILFVVFLAGILMMIHKKQTRIVIVTLLVSLMFAAYIIKSGFFFYHHNYYIIPFVPIMALIAGFALTQFKNQATYSILLVLAITESIANQYNDFFIKPDEIYKMELPEIADTISLKTDLIVINGSENPQQIYLTHRKGWTCNNNALQDPFYLQKIKDKGCKYIFVNKTLYNEELNHTVVYESQHFKVYSIN
jgi:hypothetical protein